jgi:hypothetical protein
MKATADDAALFRDEVLKWQKKLGLLDWTITVTAEVNPDSEVEALCDYDCETREATMTYYIGVENVTHPRDNAKHEILHLLFADPLLAAIEASSEEDKLVAREEHKAIARLEKVL